MLRIIMEEQVFWNGRGLKLILYLSTSQLPTSNQGYYYWDILNKSNETQKEEQEEEVKIEKEEEVEEEEQDKNDQEIN